MLNHFNLLIIHHFVESNTLLSSTVVCRLILLSAYLASNRILKMTEPLKKPVRDSSVFKRTITHAVHEAGGRRC